jgi:hypothetical protein
MSKSIASMAYLYRGCLVHSAHQALSCGVIEDLWRRICPPRLGVNFYCESTLLSHLTMFEWSKILNSNFVNDLGWRNDQYESCSSQKVMKLCS